MTDFFMQCCLCLRVQVQSDVREEQQVSRKQVKSGEQNLM